jgi:hypothetical protein
MRGIGTIRIADFGKASVEGPCKADCTFRPNTFSCVASKIDTKEIPDGIF